ncbi:hypothetical protein BV20DRAFT_807286 [Pilatotrama ljubarskyi]|nr:hypothetical protein BV20DRAFT_807286 [Pilatotrama ljubarskyi]
MGRGPKKSNVFVTCPQCGNDRLKAAGLLKHMRACAKKLGIAKAAEDLRLGLNRAVPGTSCKLVPVLPGVGRVLRSIPYPPCALLLGAQALRW